MLGLLRKTRSPIGLDIGSRYIKAAQLVDDDDAPATRPRLAASLVLERDAPGEPMSLNEARRLREVLERRGFTGRRVVVAVPSDALLTSVLQLPPRHSDAPLAEIALAEMARTHRCEPDSFEVAFWDLPESSRPAEGVPVMAAACRHEHADALLDALEPPGFEVLALDLEGWALWRAIAPGVEGDDPLLAMIDIGWQGVNFVLLYRRAVVYERMLGGTGLHALGEAIHREHPMEQDVIDYLLEHVGFGHPDDAATADDQPLAGTIRGPMEAHFDTLAQELRLSVSYAMHQYPEATLDRLVLTGGGAMIRGLPEHLSAAIDLPVAALAIEQTCLAANDERLSTALGVAVGLARYPLKEAS
ncbi:MAG: pilus assembly protein PilM [Phycisphaeraceae bacterium]